MDEKSGGFTLIELVIVVVILGILAAMVLPRFTGFTSAEEESVWHANYKTAERMYAAFPGENNFIHSDHVFNQFLIANIDEVCPADGVISYEDETVWCDIHLNKEEKPEEDSHGEEVPWLWLGAMGDVSIAKRQKRL